MSPSVHRCPSPTVPSPGSRTAPDSDSGPVARGPGVTATSAPSWRKATRESRLLPRSGSQTSNNTPTEANRRLSRPPFPPRQGLWSAPAEARALSRVSTPDSAPGPAGAASAITPHAPRGAPARLPPTHADSSSGALSASHSHDSAPSLCRFFFRRPLILPYWAPSPSKPLRRSALSHLLAVRTPQLPSLFNPQSSQSVATSLSSNPSTHTRAHAPADTHVSCPCVTPTLCGAAAPAPARCLHPATRTRTLTYTHARARAGRIGGQLADSSHSEASCSSLAEPMASPGSGFWSFASEDGSGDPENPGTGRRTGTCRRRALRVDWGLRGWGRLKEVFPLAVGNFGRLALPSGCVPDDPRDQTPHRLLSPWEDAQRISGPFR